MNRRYLDGPEPYGYHLDETDDDFHDRSVRHRQFAHGDIGGGMSQDRLERRAMSPSPVRNPRPTSPQTQVRPGSSAGPDDPESNGRMVQKAIACLSRSLKFTHLKVIELQDTVCCLDQQLKQVNSDVQLLKESVGLRSTNPGA
ncbi:unnamed protein product [Nesidiocoris tenuis]|uniref:Uncharacterized protein n=1 Tax=Nesidiocoris tenuis TaxID=355587 RepID=A0A6H5G963_9HEMI|nr:unnamed protein product [Nesidiocoris tenuis]